MADLIQQANAEKRILDAFEAGKTVDVSLVFALFINGESNPASAFGFEPFVCNAECKSVEEINHLIDVSQEAVAKGHDEKLVIVRALAKSALQFATAIIANPSAPDMAMMEKAMTVSGMAVGYQQNGFNLNNSGFFNDEQLQIFRDYLEDEN